MDETALPLPLLGSPNIRNRGACHWIKDDLIALGCGKDVIIIDSKTLKLVQICSSQSGDVTHVFWLSSGRTFTNETAVSHRDLISVDTNGELAIWNALKGEIMHRYTHPENNHRVIVDVHLSEGVDHWSRSKVYILYTGHLLVVFDHATCTFQNIAIQIGTGPDFPLTPVGIFRFCVEHHTPNPAMNRLAFLSRFENPSASSSSAGNSNTDLLLTFCSGWDYQKDNRILLRRQILLPFNRSTSSQSGASGFLTHSNSMQNLSPPVHQQSSSDTPEKTRPTSIRRLVSDIIVGADLSGSQGHGAPVQATLGFHHGIKDAILVSTESNIYLINVHFMVVLHIFSIDSKSVAPIVHTIPSHKKPCIITIHENGSVYLRKYTIVGTHIFNMELDTICASDNPRFSGKRPEIVSCGLHPFEENTVMVYFSDGRFLQYGFVSGEKGKIAEPKNNVHANTPSTPLVKGHGDGEGDALAAFSSLSLDQPDSSRAPPPISFTQKWVSPMNHVKSMLEGEYDNVKIKLKRMTPTLGQPTTLKSDGNTLILGTSHGFLIILHVVKGRASVLKKIACHSSCAVSGIEYVTEHSALTYANVSFSTNPKCELMLTDLRTGACTGLKAEAKHHIQCVSVSPLRQYFVLVYQNGASPCELWDLSRKQQIKTLPSKLPSITCVQWKERDPNSSSKDEVFYLTDYGTFLFTFRVEGSRFAAATCVKLDTNNTSSITGIPISLFTRGALVFRVDSNGTMVIYNTDKKTASPGFPVGKGPLISSTAFGNSNFIAQFTDTVELWDFQNLKKVRTLLLGKMAISAITVMKNWMVYIPTGQNSVKFLPLDPTDETISRHPTIRGDMYKQFLSPKEKCSMLYALSKDSNSRIQNLVDLCKTIGTPGEVRLWTLLKSKLQNEDSFSDVGLFCNNASFKEMLVKVSQCVWATDMNKREDVGRLLLLCGEMDRAAEVLLDTEPTSKGYVLNGMKASIAVASSNLPEQSKAVLKITATNLIACGDMDGGLELLCLLGKHSEACKYIESSNEWHKAILLCKTTLSEKNSEETLSRYAQYLVSKKCVVQAALVYIYIGKYERAAEALFGARLRHLSYLLLVFCAREQIEMNLSDHIKLAINLDFARFLFDYGLTAEAINFCDSLGNEAKDLKNELEILAS
ncbi:unnamed protein product [Orchesella dallaii]|uniref:WDR11 TPR domain-containing protein n=1 Tax=Orchesella dallaii TaxID=48710 RepID=A0ABP1S3Q2_9HEXA